MNARERDAGEAPPTASVKLERVLVGIDLGEGSTRAARWVVRHLAPGAECILVHALDVRKVPRYVRGDLSEEDLRGTLRDEARRRLDELRDELGDAVTVELREGRTHEVLRDIVEERRVDLAVMADTDGGGDGEDAPGGRTGRRMVRAMPSALLLTRGELTGGPSQVFVAVDDSPETPQVLAWARILQERFGSRINVVHVFHPVFASVGRLVSGTSARRRLEPEQMEQARAWLADEARSAGLGDDVAIDVLEGDPERTILERERELRPDLLVLGSHGAGAVERALVGSVAAGVAHDASCSVLLSGSGDDR